MKIAKCHVTGALIAQALSFPEGTEISSIVKLDVWHYDTFEFTLLNDDLREAGDNDIPLIRPVFHYENGKTELIDWGYQEVTI